MSDSITLLRDKVAQYVPPECAALLAEWISFEDVKIKITKTRHSKTGDYRPPQNGHGHRITINCDLNKYEFLVTLVHELAHLKTTRKYQQSFFRRRNVKPHGTEWKQEFKMLMDRILIPGVFPEELFHALTSYMQNPAASGCSDISLQRAFKKFDPLSHQIMLLEDIPSEAVFKLKDGRVFKKMKKMRKHFQCIEIPSKRIFSVNAMAEVEVVESA